MTTLMKVKDAEELAEKGADIISKSIKNLLNEQEQVVLAVPGGRSVAGVFKRLREKSIDWKRVHIFMADERLVPLGHPESNYLLVEKHLIADLLRKGLLGRENIHPFIMKEEPHSSISIYETDLKKYGGIYDIILVSSGEDGHIGALYPEHHSIRDDTEYFLTMDDSPKQPSQRMTMSRKLVLRARTAMVLFLGDAKQDALKKYLDVHSDFYQCPAKLVQDVHDSYAITDIRR